MCSYTAEEALKLIMSQDDTLSVNEVDGQLDDDRLEAKQQFESLFSQFERKFIYSETGEGSESLSLNSIAIIKCVHNKLVEDFFNVAKNVKSFLEEQMSSAKTNKSILTGEVQDSWKDTNPFSKETINMLDIRAFRNQTNYSEMVNYYRDNMAEKYFRPFVVFQYYRQLIRFKSVLALCSMIYQEHITSKDRSVRLTMAGNKPFSIDKRQNAAAYENSAYSENFFRFNNFSNAGQGPLEMSVAQAISEMMADFVNQQNLTVHEYFLTMNVQVNPQQNVFKNVLNNIAGAVKNAVGSTEAAWPSINISNLSKKGPYTDATRLVYNRTNSTWFVPGSEYEDDIKEQYNNYVATDVSTQLGQISVGQAPTAVTSATTTGGAGSPSAAGNANNVTVDAEEFEAMHDTQVPDASNGDQVTPLNVITSRYAILIK